MTLYEKRGRRYFPVHDDRALEGLRNGAWLVVVDGGRTSVRRLVEPDCAAFEAALFVAEGAMVAALQKEASLRPTMVPITPRARRAWEALARAMGKSVVTLERGSAVSIAEAGVAAVREAHACVAGARATTIAEA